MNGKKITAGVSALVMAGSFFSAAGINASEEFKLDQKILNQLIDYTDDGKVDENDLIHADNISMDLSGIEDISFLKYAESVKYLHLKNGDISDLSVLSGLKNLKSISLANMPVTDLSFLEGLDIFSLHLEGIEISEEEKLKYLRVEECVVPAGHLTMAGAFPYGLVSASLKMENTDIAAFGEYGDSDTADQSGYVLAKKEGETEYSVVVDGKTVKKGKITVVPAEVQNPPAVDNIVKVKDISYIYTNGYRAAGILTSDDRLWTFDGKEYKPAGENVKEFFSTSSSYGDPVCILHTDGRMTVDGKSVFEDDTVVNYMYCSYDYAYVMTDKNSLWYVGYDKGTLKKPVLITEDCAVFNRQARIVSKSDGTCFYFDASGGTVKKTDLGSHDIKKIFYDSYYESYVLDNDGSLWLMNRRERGDKFFTLYDKNVDDIGKALKGSEGLAYYKGAYRKGSKLYWLADKTDSQIKADSDTDLSEWENISYEKRPVSFYGRDYDVVPELFKGKNLDSDFVHMVSVKSEDNTEYFSFLDNYAALTDVDFTYESSFTDGKDYIVLAVRNDGSMWEYHVGENKFVRKDFGTQEPGDEPDEETVFTASDLVGFIKFMSGENEAVSEKYDMNSDGVFNIVDLVLLKEMLLSVK